MSSQICNIVAVVEDFTRVVDSSDQRPVDAYQSFTRSLWHLSRNSLQCLESIVRSSGTVQQIAKLAC